MLISNNNMKDNQRYDDNGRLIIPDDKIINNLPPNGGDKWNRLIFEKTHVLYIYIYMCCICKNILYLNMSYF